MTRALARDPDDRPESATELIRDAEAALTTGPETVTRRAPAAPARRRVHALAAAGLAAAGVVVVAVVLATGGEDPEPPDPTATATAAATSTATPTATATETATPPAPTVVDAGSVEPDGRFVPIDIDSDAIARLRFRGRAGQRASVAGAPVAIGGGGKGKAWVELLAPIDDRIAYTWFAAPAGELDASAVLPVTGRYEITIAPEHGASGKLRVGVSLDARGRLAIDGPATRVAIDRRGQNAWVAFDGKAGDRVAVTAPSVSLGPLGAGGAWVDLWGPDDERVTYGSVSARSGEAGGSVVLPLTGQLRAPR